MSKRSPSPASRCPWQHLLPPSSESQGSHPQPSRAAPHCSSHSPFWQPQQGLLLKALLFHPEHDELLINHMVLNYLHCFWCGSSPAISSSQQHSQALKVGITCHWLHRDPSAHSSVLGFCSWSTCMEEAKVIPLKHQHSAVSTTQQERFLTLLK